MTRKSQHSRNQQQIMFYFAHSVSSVAAYSAKTLTISIALSYFSFDTEGDQPRGAIRGDPLHFQTAAKKKIRVKWELLTQNRTMFSNSL